MTVVNLKWRGIDGSNLDGVLLTNGTSTINPGPDVRRDTSAGQMTTKPLVVPINGQVTLSAGTYRFDNEVDMGASKPWKFTEFRVVPAAGTFDVDDLDEVSGFSGGGVLPPEWKQYIDTQIAALELGPGGVPTGSGPLGAFIAVDVKDTTDVGRGVMTIAGADTAARKVAVLSYLGAASTTSVSTVATAASNAQTTANGAATAASSAASAASTAQSTANSASTAASSAQTAASAAVAAVTGMQDDLDDTFRVHSNPGGIPLPRPTDAPAGTRYEWEMSAAPPLGGTGMAVGDRLILVDI